MSKGFDFLKIKPAVKDHSNCKIDKFNITTQNFAEILPLHCQELVPGDNLHSLSIKTFARLSPMVVPTYSSMFYKTAAFFVPFHQVFDGADSFISGQGMHMGRTHFMRYITLSDLIVVLSKSTYSTLGSSSNFDYKIIGVDSVNVQYRKLTSEGKYLYKVLKCLGYEIPRGVDYFNPSSVWNTKMKDFKLSALPLLCYGKAYCDWMMNNQRWNGDSLVKILYDIKVNFNIGTYYTSDGHVTSDFIDLLIQSTRVNYETDYFTSLWEKPNAPLGSNGQSYGSDISIYRSSTQPNYVLNRNDENNYASITSPGGPLLEGRLMDWLSRFNDYIRRNNFVSTKDTEQILARFGIKIDDYKTRFAYRLGSSSTPIQVGDITATANSQIAGVEVPLGDYVGKGILSGANQNASFKCSDYGMLIVFSYIVPRVSYSQGFDHSVLRLKPTDFYTPEFDAMQASPVTLMEVAQCNKTEINNSSADGSKVIGFAPQYTNYLYQRDVISGDMILFDENHAWHFNRKFDDLLNRNQLIAQSIQMNQMFRGDEYNYIFTLQDSEEDKFYVTSKIEAKMTRPMASLSSKAELGDGDFTVDRGGSQAS